MSAERDFAIQFHAVVDALDQQGRRDNETMWLLGSLAARLVREARADNWTDLKLRLERPSRDALVGTLDKQATDLAAGGKTKPAYVAHLLGISLVAGTLSDPQLKKRDMLLNNFIDTAALVFIQNHNADKAARQ